LAEKRKPSTRQRPRKAVDPAELAAILTFAELHGDKAASEQFGVSCRTLQRYRAELRAGRHPALAALVAQKKTDTAQRFEDQLTGVYERGLEALRRRIDDTGQDTRMKDRDLIGAVHILGNQLVTRRALTGDDEPTRDDSAGAAPAAPGAAGPDAPPGASRAALH